MEKMFKPLLRKMKIEIEYFWRRDGDFAIHEPHVGQLEASAMEQIRFGMIKGKTQGDLSATLFRGNRTVSYSGSWSATPMEG